MESAGDDTGGGDDVVDSHDPIYWNMRDVESHGGRAGLARDLLALNLAGVDEQWLMRHASGASRQKPGVPPA